MSLSANKNPEVEGGDLSFSLAAAASNNANQSPPRARAAAAAAAGVAAGASDDFTLSGNTPEEERRKSQINNNIDANNGVPDPDLEQGRDSSNSTAPPLPNGGGMPPRALSSSDAAPASNSRSQQRALNRRSGSSPKPEEKRTSVAFTNPADLPEYDDDLHATTNGANSSTSSSPKARSRWSLVAKEIGQDDDDDSLSSSMRRNKRSSRMSVVGSVVRKSFIETKIRGRSLVFWLRADEREEDALRDRIEADEDIARHKVYTLEDLSKSEVNKNMRRVEVQAANITQREKEEIQRWKQLRYRLRCEEDEGRVVVFLVEDRAFREIISEEKGKRLRILNAARNRRAKGSSTGRVPVRLDRDLAEHLRKMKIRAKDHHLDNLTSFEDRAPATFSGLSPSKSPPRNASSHSHHNNGSSGRPATMAAPAGGSSSSPVPPPSRLPPIDVSPIHGARGGATEGGSFDSNIIISPGTNRSTSRPYNASMGVKDMGSLETLQRVGRGFMLRRGPVGAATTFQPNSQETLEEWEETNAIRKLLAHQRKAAMPNRKGIPAGFRTTTPLLGNSLSLQHSVDSQSPSKSRGSTAISHLGSTVNTVDTSPKVLIYDRKVILDEQAKEASARTRRLQMIDQDLSKRQRQYQLKELRALRDLQRIKDECEREKVTLREKRKQEARKFKTTEQQRRFKQEAKRLRELDQREIDRVEIHVALRQKHMGETRIEALKRTLVELPGASRIASMSAQLSVAKAERNATSDE